LYSFSAVDGAARDRDVEHGSLPHVGLTCKHNGEVCVDTFAVPKFRHDNRLLLGQTIERGKGYHSSPSARESPSLEESETREVAGVHPLFD